MGRAYDAIVVGARCAGAPTAMLLARPGLGVLLLDRRIVRTIKMVDGSAKPEEVA